MSMKMIIIVVEKMVSLGWHCLYYIVNLIKMMYQMMHSFLLQHHMLRLDTSIVIQREVSHQTKNIHFILEKLCMW